MDDLISRKAVAEKMKNRRDYVGRPSDPDCIIADEPSVPAVPLDKLCELLAGNSIIPCEYCQYFSNKHCTVISDTNKSCPNSADSWQNTLTKWMEGLDATD